jgi:LacI family transcriptional regulator
MARMKRALRVAVLGNVARRYDRRVIQGVADFARQSGRWSLYVEEDPLQKLPTLERWDGDGIITNFDDHKTAVAVAGLKIPVVGFGGGLGWYDPASKVPYFTTDNLTIGRLAAEHLLDCGLTRLAFYGNPRRRRHQWSEQREQAFQDRARAAGVSVAVYHGRHADAEHWMQQLRELTVWLKSLTLPVGLMACTDIRARQVLEACRMLGARVPEDVAVIGVDNDEMICEFTAPPLSSVEQGSRQIGYQAAALLDRLMAGRRAPQLRTVVAPEGLIARQSTDVLTCDDPDLGAAIRYVRQHACDPICVDDVLQRVHLSRSTLEKRFQAVLGRTVHAEIQRVQVDHAAHLLSHTDLQVKQIAKRCGFKYVPYLTRVFRLHRGQSPIEFRRRAKTGDDRPAGSP